MIDPTLITNRNRLLPEGRGIVVIYKSDFYVDYPVYEILDTKANEHKFGTLVEKKEEIGELKWERKHVPFNIDAKVFFNDLQVLGTLNPKQEAIFWTKPGNVNKMRYLYSITNLRMIV